MKLRELNKLVEKKNFFGIKKDLEKHIDKLEGDAKEVRIDTITTVEKLALKLVDKIEGLQKDHTNGKLDFHTDFAGLKDRIIGFQNRFMDYMRSYSDIEFQKDIIMQVRKHLEELVAKLEDSFDTVTDLEEISRQLEKETGGRMKLKRRKTVPRGMAQDLNTRKHSIQRGNK